MVAFPHQRTHPTYKMSKAKFSILKKEIWKNTVWKNVLNYQISYSGLINFYYTFLNIWTLKNFSTEHCIQLSMFPWKLRGIPAVVILSLLLLLFLKKRKKKNQTKLINALQNPSVLLLASAILFINFSRSYSQVSSYEIFRNSYACDWMFRHELDYSYSLYIFSGEQAWNHFIEIPHMLLLGGNIAR